MTGMRLLSLGVGNAFSALYYSSCFALEAGGHWLLVDCPHPIRKLTREASKSAGLKLDVDQFDGVVLTHLHADHASGVEGLAYYFRYCVEKKPTLVAHPDVAAGAWPRHLDGKLEDFFDVLPLHEDRAVSVGPFAIEGRKTIHSVPTCAVRIKAKRRTLGYSADTAFDLSLIDWMAKANLIIHEAGGSPVHTDHESLATLPAAVRRKLRIIHYPDSLDLSKVPLEAIRQGELYNV